MPRSPSKTPSDKRLAAYWRGHRGEALAAFWLQLKLYRIRDRRFKTPLGEIDLVVEKGTTIAFVEVKQRAAEADEALTFASITSASAVPQSSGWRETPMSPGAISDLM